MSTRLGSKPKMPQFKIIGHITTMGEDKMVITIPKKFHNQIKPLKGKDAVITIDTDPFDELPK